MAGELFDTYVAALQHDLVNLPEGTTLLGVVRRPTPWFAGTIDENVSTLGPPASLLEETKTVTAELAAERSQTRAHNLAWERTAFADRYRSYLETNQEPQSALGDVSARLAAGESIALVCYENTAEKRCHREILRDYLE